MRVKLKELLNKITNNQTVVYSRARYQNNADASFSDWIPFNTVEDNIGGGTWNSSGAYVVPKAGFYLVNFTCYSNSAGSGRAAVNNKTRGTMSMCNANYTTSITAIYQCEIGDELVAGAYSSSFPISIYGASGHNSFTVVRLPIS